MSYWVDFMDTYLCDDEFSECHRPKDEPIHFLRPVRFFLYDPSWTMLADYLKDGDVTNLRD